MHTRDRRLPSRRVAATLTLIGLLAVSCGGGDGGQDPAADATGDTGAELAVQMASFDLSVGDDQRFTAGLLTPEQAVVALGEVTMRFGFLGEDEGASEVETDQETTAAFLPVPGDEPEQDGDEPIVVSGQGAGVYETEVDFDEPGFYGVQVEATMADGSTRTGTTTFEVGAEPLVPAVGDDALATDNLTVDSDAPAGTIDSRAREVEDVPDPQLHDTTVADALEEGRPILLVVSTPVFCTSRFCGPITNTIADLADEYDDRAEFVHIEVWEDFDAQELNDAAAEWIQTERGGNEPWTFLIDADGKIAARWDNVADLDEMTELLEALPAG